MKLGVSIRTMGPQSTRDTILGCARAAEAAGLDDLFVVDHIAIPPDDAEGSDGRYLDPLSVLAYLAGCTERIGLGTSVLILPYRPALPTAKVIANRPTLPTRVPSERRDQTATMASAAASTANKA